MDDKKRGQEIALKRYNDKGNCIKYYKCRQKRVKEREKGNERQTTV